MHMAITVPRYTIDALERLPSDGNRYELLDGVLLVTPAPAPSHQIVASRLQVRLSAAVQATGHAFVVAPGAILHPPATQLQPDLLVYPQRFPVETEWAKITEHWLAVEVLSPSSRVYDREFKRDAYFVLGVAEVWLVDLRTRTVEVCRPGAAGESRSDVVKWRIPTLNTIVSISLDEIFAGFA